jgi:chromosome segregation ATPase
MQGLAAAQKDANKRLTEAEGRVESLRAAAASGKGIVRAKDNPTLAALEARASQIREELREMSRRYTPDYLDMDPQARALRARLAELEEQITAQRASAPAARSTRPSRNSPLRANRREGCSSRSPPASSRSAPSQPASRSTSRCRRNWRSWRRPTRRRCSGRPVSARPSARACRRCRSWSRR